MRPYTGFLAVFREVSLATLSAFSHWLQPWFSGNFAPMATAPPLLCSLWIGERLGPIERACLRSALRHHHPVRLYCYDLPKGVPIGVEVRDAAPVVKREHIIHHTSGSPALFTNLFRYELQRRSIGTWIDCDHYCLAPMAADTPYLLGFEDQSFVASGVLRMPPDSPVLAPLLALFEQRTIPSWLPWRERARARWRRALHGSVDLARMPWGSVGPRAVTALMRQHGLLHHASPPCVFYPVHWQQADWIRDPQQCLEQKIAPSTLGLHLWNERIREWKHQPASRGSFLARLHDEGG